MVENSNYALHQLKEAQEMKKKCPETLPRQTRAHFNAFLHVKMWAFYTEKTLKNRFLFLKKSTLRASLS